MQSILGSHRYIQIDDSDCDLIQYRSEELPAHQQQHQQQPCQPLSPASGHSSKSANSRGISVGVFLLALCSLAVLAIVYGRNRFGRNDTDGRPDATRRGLAFVDSRHPLAVALSPFERAVTVETDCGKIVGTVEENAFAFKGIPYALPPVGALRWSRPVPLDGQNYECRLRRQASVYYANQYGPICAQFNGTVGEIVGAEDCLYLNVWTPRIDDSAKLNVMIYIHDNTELGSGQQWPLSPTGYLAGELNAVLVSVNYRLNAFGFLALELLANSNANSSLGNYGLWDVIVAVNWVTANIAAFGGDPNRLTIFGADGDIIDAIINSDTYSGLARLAWIAGPPERDRWTREPFAARAKFNREYRLPNTDCSAVECLRLLSAGQVINELSRRNVTVCGQMRTNGQMLSPIVIDEEIVFSTPIESQRKTPPVLIINPSVNTSVANFSFPVYLYSGSENLQSDCQLCDFFEIQAHSAGVEDSHSSQRSAVGQALRKIVFNFIGGNYSGLSKIN